MGGILGKEYHTDRVRKTARRYRLERRIAAVGEAIAVHVKNPSSSRCLEVGAADGLLLAKLNKRFGFKQAVGIEINKELVMTNSDTSIILQTGNAEALCFPLKRFDIVIAVGMIEHLDNPERMIEECYRVLTKGGIAIITARNSLNDAIGKKIGSIDREIYLRAFTTPQICSMLETSGFEISERRHFMLYPSFPVPFEKWLEGLLHLLGLSGRMHNQIIVGRKP